MAGLAYKRIILKLSTLWAFMACLAYECIMLKLCTLWPV